MKKFFALVLAVLMLASLAVPAMATEYHASHTITIDDSRADRVYVAYQIFSGDVTGEDPNLILANVGWGSGVDLTKKVSFTVGETTKELTLLEALWDTDVNNASLALAIQTAAAELKESLGITGTLNEAQGAQAIVTALAKYDDDSVQAKEFARLVEHYVTGGSTSVRDGDVYKISPLSDGYYMVQETTDPSKLEGDTYTSLILELVKSITIATKGDKVTPEKKIIEGGAPTDACADNIGDVVEFQLKGNMPDNLTEYKKFYYALVDTQSAGLTFNPDSVQVYLINGDTQTLISSDKYQLALSTDEDFAFTNKAGTESATFAVVFEDLLSLGLNVLPTSHIVVKYTSTVNEDAVVGGNGNPNDLHIVYDHDPYTDGEYAKTPEDEVKVYTFELDVTKKNGKTNEVLAGVEFVLYRTRTQNDVAVIQYAVVNNGKLVGWTNWQTEEDLIDYVDETYPDLSEEDRTAKINELKAAPGVATTLVTDASGMIKVAGLDVGTYHLKETKALDGYDMIADIEVIISAEYTTVDPVELTKLTIKVNGGAANNGDLSTGIVAMTVINNPGNTLPSTGGIGTTLFYIFGGLMVAGAAVLMITKKRMAV